MATANKNAIYQFAGPAAHDVLDLASSFDCFGLFDIWYMSPLRALGGRRCSAILPAVSSQSPRGPRRLHIYDGFERRVHVAP